MESAANLADKYSRVYEVSEKTEKEQRKKNNRVVTRKLLYSAVTIIMQTFALLIVVLFVLLPFKKSFNNVLSKYFSEKKVNFSSDILIDDFRGSVNTIKEVDFIEVEQPQLNSHYAKLSSLHVSGSIYFGVSEQALLKGVCQDSKTSLPGLGKPIMLYGYSGTYLSDIEKVKVGSKISITTNYGVYEYEITEKGSFENSSTAPYNLQEDKEQLIICTDYNFDEQKMDYTETYYVIADKVSGPEIIY